MLFWYVCWGLTLLNTRGHNATVPACSIGTLTCFDQCAATQECQLRTQDMTLHPVTVFRHGADLSLCYPLMWNVTLEYTATHFNVLGETRPRYPSPRASTHTSERSTLSW